MDPLSDLLVLFALDAADFYAIEAAEPWSVEAVVAKELAPRILPSAEHLISHHILTEGRCYGGYQLMERYHVTKEHYARRRSRRQK